MIRLQLFQKGKYSNKLIVQKDTEYKFNVQTPVTISKNRTKVLGHIPGKIRDQDMENR